MTPTTLYRLFDVRGSLLYVGISGTTISRLNQHAADKEWFSEVVQVICEHFPSRSEAAAAELRAIRTEMPVFNRLAVSTYEQARRQTDYRMLGSSPDTAWVESLCDMAVRPRQVHLSSDQLAYLTRLRDAEPPPNGPHLYYRLPASIRARVNTHETTS
jgi:predicted GIY-YIG superfamily endonuclease